MTTFFAYSLVLQVDETNGWDKKGNYWIRVYDLNTFLSTINFLFLDDGNRFMYRRVLFSHFLKLVLHTFISCIFILVT